jgi:hypothetical protein
MAELAPSGGGPNRLFLVLAIGLGGLLILGLIGLGAFLLLQPRAATTAAATPTRLLPTATRVALATAAATAVPTESPTNTPVIGAPTPGATVPATVAVTTTVTVTATVAVTGTVAPGTTTPTGGLPDTGVGEDLLLLGVGMMLVLIIFAARRARSGAAA